MPPPPKKPNRGVQYFTVGSLGGFNIFSDSICDSKSLWGKEVTQDDNYGNMGCEVFKRGIQNLPDHCILSIDTQGRISDKEMVGRARLRFTTQTKILVTTKVQFSVKFGTNNLVFIKVLTF